MNEEFERGFLAGMAFALLLFIAIGGLSILLVITRW